ncbi:hypothetical protein TNCV_1888631 [Trichonephila clavipes]|nr:hypothetical protein TNCV_1888631 [Trichonephila clavipes]
MGGREHRNGNRCAAVWLYGKRYLTKRQPNHQTFTRVYQNLAEYGSFRTVIVGTGRLRTERTPIFKEGVFHAVDRNLGTIVRTLAVLTASSRTNFHRMLQGKALLPFHVQSYEYYSQMIIPNVSRLRCGL